MRIHIQDLGIWDNYGNYDFYDIFYISGIFDFYDFFDFYDIFGHSVISEDAEVSETAEVTVISEDSVISEDAGIVEDSEDAGTVSNSHILDNTLHAKRKKWYSSIGNVLGYNFIDSENKTNVVSLHQIIFTE